MSARRPIEIVGGGLAGLSLGLALRRAGVEVTLFEAGDYPRHRVCGEFITGLDRSTIECLGLGPLLAQARTASEVTWHRDDRLLRRHRLPEPAIAISRHKLDTDLAEAFVAAGGRLLPRTCVPLADAPAGRVFCNGRRRERSRWMGLKLHVAGLALDGDLELHLGRNAYAGLCAVGDGQVNVCGLFRSRRGLATTRDTALVDHLRAAGLHALARRIGGAHIVPDSTCAVAGIEFRAAPAPRDRIVVGDAYAMIAPYTGHGMAMAFQSAEEVLDPLLAWAHGDAEWQETVQIANQRIRRRFRRRLAIASWFHPFVSGHLRQRCFTFLQRRRALPMAALYQLVH